MLKTPFEDLLPPLSKEEFNALKSDIRANGILDPVTVDEAGNILDGHHRYMIDRTAKTRVVRGLSTEEKKAFVIRANLTRRNLSPSQKREVSYEQRRIAKKLRETDAKKWTIRRVGELLGVSKSTVSAWFSDLRTLSNSGHASIPDARVKISPVHRPIIAERVFSGESQAQVAADYGVSQRTVSTIVTFEKQKREHKKRNETILDRRIASLDGTYDQVDIRAGDFRDVLRDVARINAIITDPPYGADGVELFRDLGKFSAERLTPDGVLLAYSGQKYLPEVMNALSEHLDYLWTLAVFHQGNGNLTFMGARQSALNLWKPVLLFTQRGGIHGRLFRDVVESENSADKLKHNWAQPVSEAKWLIESFTNEGDFVVDPFAGSGTVGEACRQLKRRFAGAEILLDTPSSPLLVARF